MKKEWLVILTKFDTGTHWVLLVRAKTSQAAKKKAMESFGATQGDLAYAFDLAGLQQALSEQIQDTHDEILTIVDI